MEIIYRNKKTEKLCTNPKYARKVFGPKIGEKLLQKISLLEGMECLHDAVMYRPFHFHSLKLNRKGQHALDVAGRRENHRIIIEPLDDNGEKYETPDIHLISKSTKVILIIEVSDDHYG